MRTLSYLHDGETHTCPGTAFVRESACDRQWRRKPGQYFVDYPVMISMYFER